MEKFKRAGSSAFRIASDLAITQTPLINNVLDILSQHPEIIVNAIKHIDNATLTDLLRNIIGTFYTHQRDLFNFLENIGSDPVTYEAIVHIFADFLSNIKNVNKQEAVATLLIDILRTSNIKITDLTGIAASIAGKVTWENLLPAPRFGIVKNKQLKKRKQINDPKKIYNPATKRYVLRSGQVGKALLKKRVKKP
jgi:hypothetical protein